MAEKTQRKREHGGEEPPKSNPTTIITLNGKQRTVQTPLGPVTIKKLALRGHLQIEIGGLPVTGFGVKGLVLYR